MKLLEIKNIIKKDIPLYYRNEYTADAEFILIGDKTTNIAIAFSVEMAPTGEKTIEIEIKDSIEYPVVPILKLLKEEINVLEKKGLLL